MRPRCHPPGAGVAASLLTIATIACAQLPPRRQTEACLAGGGGPLSPRGPSLRPVLPVGNGSCSPPDGYGSPGGMRVSDPATTPRGGSSPNLSPLNRVSSL